MKDGKFKAIRRTAKLRNTVTGEIEPTMVQHVTGQPIEFRGEINLRKVYEKLKVKETDPEKILRLEQTMNNKIEESKQNQKLLQELNLAFNQIFATDFNLDTTSYRVRSTGNVNSFQGRRTVELVVEKTEGASGPEFKIQKRAVWNGKTGFDAKRFRPFKFDNLKIKVKGNSYEIVEEETDHYDMSKGKEQGRMFRDALCTGEEGYGEKLKAIFDPETEIPRACHQVSKKFATK